LREVKQENLDCFLTRGFVLVKVIGLGNQTHLFTFFLGMRIR